MTLTTTHNTMATMAGVGRVRAAADHGDGLMGFMTWSAPVPSSCSTPANFAGIPQNETTKRSTRRLGKRPT